MNKKMIILSHDAMVWEDLETLRQKPTFGSLLQRGAAVRTLRTIYPSITYPVHASIISGQYPDKHGIINNELAEIGVLASPWHWFARDNQVRTLFTAAKEAGLTTAAVFWPVSGLDPDIDHLVAEYWSQSPQDDLEDVFRRSGTSEAVMEAAVKPNLHLLRGHERQHPAADEFVIRVACDILRHFKPDLLAVHPAAIDGARHQSGLFSSLVDEMLDHTENWTTMIRDAAREAGVLEQTDIINLSDHGQLEIKRVLNINVILRDHGLIQVDDEEQFRDWDAFSKSAALSAHVYLKNPNNQALHKKVHQLLLHLRDEGIYGISEVFTREEIREKEHLDGAFSFVIESDGFTSFGNDWRRPIVRSFDLADYRFGRATHGHLPDKGPQPTLIATGPSFKPGATVQRRPIVDVAPTLARALNIDLGETDGQVIWELLQTPGEAEA
jgi:predicted AlkP superfamily pyrophosphatase or phosphodiesterase